MLRTVTFCCAALCLASLPSAAAQEAAPPEALGLDGARLAAMSKTLAARRTKNFLVARRGKIVFEWYAADSGPGTRHYTASLAKAIVGGLSLTLALQDKRLQTDDLAAKFVPGWREDPRRSRISIRHLATHSSGIEDAEQDQLPHEKLPGWKGAFWRRDPDPFSIALRQAPVVFEPGTKYAYSNPGLAVLAYVVTAALRGAPQTNIRTLLKERIMDPLGIPEDDWSIGYGRAYEVDSLQLYANWGGGSYTARAVARVGQLMLQRGQWGKQQLLSPEWVDKVTAYAGTPLPERRPNPPAPGSGLGWWTNLDGVWKKVPRDAFAGAGAGHQVLLVVPSLDLVMVRNGGVLNEPSEDLGFWGAVERFLFDPLMETLMQYPDNPAAVSRPPYPPSPVIGGARFADFATIVRQAPGSDNWPITWADDDDLYTAYGDGWGFEPLLKVKLGQGFARISGGPENFRAVNLRSESGENLGQGPKGAKASGMLMLGGVLYMWERNVGNSQLAWSEDRGRTWQRGFRFETSFGSPAFLNFGRHYAGARDEYVYSYSQDGPSAYESYDHVVLARVPAARIRERAAYEFFVRLDGAGRPVWTKDIAQRGAVFTHPGRCQRVDAVYVPGLRRYLLAVGYSHDGGWGIFDAPEPWGPWTTVFHTVYWGLGGTHGYRLPSKWISPDGKTLWLVFSGRPHNGTDYDAFCLRRLTLE
jgi:CubicO group peptidase (beta-lactamase class C family)